MPTKFLPIYELDEIAEIFGYPSRRSLNKALHSGQLPLKLFKLRGRRVCHISVVDSYFKRMEEEGLKAIEKHASYDWDD